MRWFIVLVLMLALTACAGARKQSGLPQQSGVALYARACAGCHGVDGEGVTGLTQPLQESRRIDQLDDAQLLALIKNGVAANDPANSSGLAMPPRGGDRSLDDDALLAIVVHVRGLQESD